uniref:Metacaspase n=1 Tax=Nannochloropsis gaditana (strain CCMP526) TaxID=1093141 RepID=I2CPA5_NANGC
MDALKAAFGKQLEKQANKVIGDVLGKVTGGNVKMPGALSEEEAPAPVPFSSDCSGRKKAVFVGINYFKTKAELHGCINDVKNVQAFIMEQYGFSRENIKVLTDEPASGNEPPTRTNILDALRWLVEGATAGDSLFFHYSGHGGTARDLDGDEVDNFDETILPVDFEAAGQILDDEIHAILVAPLPAGVRLTSVFDSCHSGSAMDLPWSYKVDGSLDVVIIDNRKAAIEAVFNAGVAYFKGDKQRAMGHGMEAVKHMLTPGGNEEARKKAEKERTNTDADVIQFSGCRDDQTSADAKIDGQPTGAASYALLTCLRENSKQTYTDLLQSMRKVLEGKYTQIPQLSTAHPIDLKVAFTM